MRIHSLFYFQNLHGSSNLDLSVVKCLPNIRKIPLKELMFQFKYTKNDLYHKYLSRFCKGNQLCFTICRNFNNAYFTELLITSLYWLQGFSNQINETCYSVVESCPIVNKNIAKSKIKFKINHASLNDYKYAKLQLSLKGVSLQIC